MSHVTLSSTSWSGSRVSFENPARREARDDFQPKCGFSRRPWHRLLCLHSVTGSCCWQVCSAAIMCFQTSLELLNVFSWKIPSFQIWGTVLIGRWGDKLSATWVNSTQCHIFWNVVVFWPSGPPPYETPQWGKAYYLSYSYLALTPMRGYVPLGQTQPILLCK